MGQLIAYTPRPDYRPELCFYLCAFILQKFIRFFKPKKPDQVRPLISLEKLFMLQMLINLVHNPPHDIANLQIAHNQIGPENGHQIMSMHN